MPLTVLTTPEHCNTMAHASPSLKRGEGGSNLKALHAPAPILRRFALFMDGITRATLLPFGPKLVYRILYGLGEPLPSLWSNVAFFLSMLVSIYIVGRWMGQSLALWFSFGEESRLRVYVARLGGTLLSLHFFTYFVGLSSIRTLLLTRFFSALFAGILCGMTRSIELPEDVQFSIGGSMHSSDSLDEETARAARKRDTYIPVDTASGTVKTYLAGLSVSILSGGPFYHNFFTNPSFQAWTSTYLYKWFLLILLLVGVATEIALRRLFASVSKKYQKDFKRILPSKDKFVGLPLTPISPRKSLKVLEDPLVFSSPFRARTESYSTVEEAFFDCHSVFSDQPEGMRSPPLSPICTVVAVTVEETQIAQYVQGKCVYPDGSAAYVPQGDCIATVPENYMKFYSNNEAKAQKAWADTQAWRLEKRVWKIHSIPNRWFSKIKDAYPHFAHGYSKHGYPIIYEQPGKMNLKELFRNGCHISDMIHHYTFFMEFVSNRICASDEVRSKMGPNAPPHSSSTWGIMVVMDIENAGIGHLSTDVIRYLKEAGGINSRHYPLSMKRAFVINVPFWFAGAWGPIKAILPESVHVDILSKSKYLDVLREYVDDEQIPPEYGGTSPYRLGEHPFEIELRRLAEEAQSGDELENDDAQHDTPTKRPLLSTIPPLVPLVPLVEEEDVEQGTFLKAEPLEQSPRTKAIRRKGMNGKTMRHNGHSNTNGESYKGGKSSAGQSDIFMVVNLIYCIWSAVQGATEVAIPLWILTPSSKGGLGYSPFRSGISMFCSCLALLCIFQTNLLCFVSRIPFENPLRGLRFGVGSGFFLFALLGALPIYSE